MLGTRGYEVNYSWELFFFPFFFPCSWRNKFIFFSFTTKPRKVTMLVDFSILCSWTANYMALNCLRKFCFPKQFFRMLREIWEFSGLALLGCVISVENSGHFLNQSESKLKPIATFSLAFSRASSILLVFTHFDFSLVPPDIFLTVIGCCAYYSFGFTTLSREALYSFSLFLYWILRLYGYLRLLHSTCTRMLRLHHRPESTYSYLLLVIPSLPLFGYKYFMLSNHSK